MEDPQEDMAEAEAPKGSRRSPSKLCLERASKRQKVWTTLAKKIADLKAALLNITKRGLKSLGKGSDTSERESGPGRNFLPLNKIDYF